MGGESEGTRLKKRCEARLRALVPEEETIVAAGTADELSDLKGDIGSGTGWTFLVVTPQRVLFSAWGGVDAPVNEIRFDDVSGWGDGRQYNAYALLLKHLPVKRLERVDRKVLWIKRGTEHKLVTRKTTIFRFSRPETEAATAIRKELQRRTLPYELLRFEERSREERTRGSHVMLTAMDRDEER